MTSVILRHYPSLAARRADMSVHIIGLMLSTLGGIVMLALSRKGHGILVYPVAIYNCGLVLMITFSLAYNLSFGVHRPLLRRLDHIGIFVMIAGTYTPLTTIILSGGWAWGMTAAVWGLAGLGIYGKATGLNLPDRVWTGLYLALGWLVIVAIGPIAQHVSAAAVVLLALGGLIYTVGAIFYVVEVPDFWRSIWHGHVVIAAGVHWVAILIALFCPPFTPTSTSGFAIGVRPDPQSPGRFYRSTAPAARDPAIP